MAIINSISITQPSGDPNIDEAQTFTFGVTNVVAAHGGTDYDLYFEWDQGLGDSSGNYVTIPVSGGELTCPDADLLGQSNKDSEISVTVTGVNAGTYYIRGRTVDNNDGGAEDLTGTQVITVNAASGEDALLADDVESASEVTTPVLGQTHVLNATDAQSLSQVDSPAVGQEHDLLADDVESASELSSPVLAELSGDNLLADDVESTSEVTTPAIGQAHIFDATDAESLSEVTSPAIGQEHDLLADDTESTSEVSTPAVGQEHGLLAEDAQSLSEVTNPVLTESSDDVLLADDVESASEVTAPAVGQEHALLSDGVQSTSEVTSPSLGQTHVISAADVQSLSELSAPVLVNPGDVFVTDYPATEYFPTGQNDVTIVVIDPYNGSTVSLSSSACIELGSSGLYFWDSVNLVTQPTGLKAYSYKMTDGATTQGGTFFVFSAEDSARLAAIHKRMDLDTTDQNTYADDGSTIVNDEFTLTKTDNGDGTFDVIKTAT